MKTITEQEATENADLEGLVQPDSDFKNMIVEYVGENSEGIDPADPGVTVSMIVNTFAKEFPEFLMAVAEENWVRGYQQAINDVQVGMELERKGEISEEQWVEGYHKHSDGGVDV